MSTEPRRLVEVSAALTCPMCGRAPIKLRPRTSKLRYPHKCPHGEECMQGNPLIGTHSFLPSHSTNCADCRAQYKNHPRGFGRPIPQWAQR